MGDGERARREGGAWIDAGRSRHRIRGLIRSESVAHLVAEGFDVLGVENDMRAKSFGSEASTRSVTERLRRSSPEFRSLELDVRDAEGMERLFASHGAAIAVVVHTTAQPSHDWAAAVYNLGGGRHSNCSLIEAIELEIASRELNWSLSDRPRLGDHRWWISDLGEFQRDYPDWRPDYDVRGILREMHDQNAERWLPAA